MTSTRSVDIYEGNATLLRLMTEILTEAGLVVERGGESAPREVVGDLLIIDVDSGLPDIEGVAALYGDASRPVLFCGLRPSRDDHTGKAWLDRPFSPAALIDGCVEALGVLPGELSPSSDDSGNLEADQVTRELAYDESVRLEEGLELGADATDAELDDFDDFDDKKADFESNGYGDDFGDSYGGEEAQTSEATSYEVVSIEDASDSFILEISDLERGPASAGRLAGEVRRRRIDPEELRNMADGLPRSGRRSPSFHTTMPDSPAALSEASETSEAYEDGPEDTHERRSDRDRELDESSQPEAVEAGSDLGSQLRGVSRMLAHDWYRVGLAARTEDRAERIEAVLKAAISRGTRGASDELQRIPPGVGFLGSLEALPVIDLLRTVRDRNLRGRLELSMPTETYVLYLDTGELEDIDALSGPLERLLLDILHREGAIADEAHAELVEACDSQDLYEPLEMRLLADEWVNEATLQRGRGLRAKALFGSLFGNRVGTFAFLEVRPGDGQPWPVSPLRLDVDQLLLEILRESSVDTGDSQATMSTRLVLDSARAASVDPRLLSKEEREVMAAFREGETLDAARQRLAGREAIDVEAIVDRLKKLELLKRSNPNLRVPDSLVGRKPLPKETAIRDWSDVLSAEERKLAKDEPTATVSPHGLDLPSVEFELELELDDVDEVEGFGDEDPPTISLKSAADDPPTINLKPSLLVGRPSEPDDDPSASDLVEEAAEGCEAEAGDADLVDEEPP